MVEVRITEKALEDIIAIGQFISRDSLKYSKITVQKLFEFISKLEEFPELGRIVPEVNTKSVREIIIGNYRIIYLVISKKRIDIIAVHNSARNLTKRHVRSRRS